MSAPAFMRLYVADFVADTLDMSAEEVGAYFLLCMSYWRNRGLPKDEELLARIARLDPMRWQCVRNALAMRFSANWRHRRIEAELEKAASKSNQALISASKRWKDKPKWNNAKALLHQHNEGNAYQMPDISTSSTVSREPKLSTAALRAFGKTPT